MPALHTLTLSLSNMSVETITKLIILLYVALMSTVNGMKDIETSITNDNIAIKSFIKTYLHDPVTFIISNLTGYESILHVNYSRLIINKQWGKNLILEKTSSFILIINDLEWLEISLKKLIKLRMYTRQWFLVIFQKPVTKVKIRQAFSMLFKYNVYNVVGYYRNDTFYTWYPYDKNSKCGSKVNLLKVGERMPFEVKVPKRFHRCPVRVMWGSTSIFIRDPHNKTYPGALILFLNTMAEKMNLNLTYVENDTQYTPMFLHTGSYEYLIKEMKRQNVDIVPNVIVQENLAHTLENSFSIYQSKVSIILPSRRPNLTVNIFKIYSLSVTLLGLVVLAICTLLWKFLTGRYMIKSALTILRICWQLVIPKVPERTPTRILFMSFLLFIVWTTIGYQTQLGSLLTKPYFEGRIRTIRKLLLETDINIRAYNLTLNSLYSHNELKTVLDKRWKRCPSDTGTLELISGYIKNKTEAITLIDYDLQYFKNPEKVNVLPETVTVVDTMATMKRGSPILEAVNFWIYNIKERGLMHKFIQLSSIPLEKFVVEDYSRLKHRKIDLQQLQAAFYILLIGTLTASVVFMLEFMCKKIK